MKVLALIPARGGSKGIPRKNLQRLGGRPLIEWTIRASLMSRADRTVVSTDDDEIAAVARSAGAEVPFRRPPELSGDRASSLSALLHAVQTLEREEGYQCDAVALLQPTSPFRTAAHVDEAILTAERLGVTSVLGVAPVVEHPYMMFERRRDGRLVEHVQLDGPKPLRRQDFPELLVTNASLYLTRRAYFEGACDPQPVFDWESLAGVVMDRVSSHDINDPVDLAVANAMVEMGLVGGDSG